MSTRSMAAAAASGLAVLGIALLPGLAAGAGAEAAGYKVDPAHSSAVFRIKHLNVSYFWGRFNDLSGTVSWSPDAPQAAAFDIQIKAESIDTNSERRDNHLKSPDFFNARQFPTISFKSKSAKKAGENKLEVTGDFTLHGVTKEITVPVELTGSGKGPRGGELVGFETTFNIKRTDYGMNYGVGQLGEEVRIIVAIEAARS